MYDSKRMNKHSQNIHNVQFVDVLDEENIQDYDARGVAVQGTAQYQKRSGRSALNGKVERSAPMIFFLIISVCEGYHIERCAPLFKFSLVSSVHRIGSCLNLQLACFFTK